MKNNSVSIINLDPEIKKKIDYQLEPLIKETEGTSDNFIYVIL